jgi:hypothetical protein
MHGCAHGCRLAEFLTEAAVAVMPFQVHYRGTMGANDTVASAHQVHDNCEREQGQQNHAQIDPPRLFDGEVHGRLHLAGIELLQGNIVASGR